MKASKVGRISVLFIGILMMFLTSTVLFAKEPVNPIDQEFLKSLSDYVSSHYLISVPIESVKRRRGQISKDVCFFLDHYEEVIPYLIASNHKTYDRYRVKEIHNS